MNEIFKLNPELINDLKLVHKDFWWSELNIIMLKDRAYSKFPVKMY